jgi:hypothetical protein
LLCCPTVFNHKVIVSVAVHPGLRPKPDALIKVAWWHPRIGMVMNVMISKSTHTGFRFLMLWALAIALSARLAAAGYTNDAGTILLDHLDGTTAGNRVGTTYYTNGLVALAQCLQVPQGGFVMYSSAIPYSSSGTYEAWVRPSQWPCSLITVNGYYTTSQPSAGYVMHLTLNANGTVHWYGGGNFDSLDPVPTNQWSHVAVTWGANGTSIYINGIENAHTPTKYNPGGGYLYLNSSWGNAAIGGLDEIRVSNIARSASELRAHYLTNLPVYHQVDVVIQGSGVVNPGSGLYEAGTNLNLSATPEPGWLFMGWAGSLTGGYAASNITLMIDTPKQITATFSADADADGLLNPNEWALGTDPRQPDTDHDGFDDRFEVDHGYAPLVSDAPLTDYIRTNASVFGLYPSNAVLNVAVGRVLARITNGQARLSLQLQQCNVPNGSWTNAGPAVEWTMPVSGDQLFFRIQANPNQP